MYVNELQAKAYRHLKEMIVSGQLEPDVIYSERKIAAKLGISRTPLRDAIHSLVQEKYIEIVPNRGFRMHQLNSQDIKELYQARAAIEGYCTLQITKTLEEEKKQVLFNKLENILSQQQEITARNHDVTSFMDLDSTFHMEIISTTQNVLFVDSFMTLMFQIKYFGRLSLEKPGRMEETLQEHRDIIDAMRSGDAIRVYQTTVAHIDKPKDLIIKDFDIV